MVLSSWTQAVALPNGSHTGLITQIPTELSEIQVPRPHTLPEVLIPLACVRFVLSSLSFSKASADDGATDAMLLLLNKAISFLSPVLPTCH